MVASLAERAEAVRDRRVEPHEDNMLKITNDGRKLPLEQVGGPEKVILADKDQNLQTFAQFMDSYGGF